MCRLTTTICSQSYTRGYTPKLLKSATGCYLPSKKNKEAIPPIPLRKKSQSKMLWSVSKKIRSNQSTNNSNTWSHRSTGNIWIKSQLQLKVLMSYWKRWKLPEIIRHIWTIMEASLPDQVLQPGVIKCRPRGKWEKKLRNSSGKKK